VVVFTGDSVIAQFVDGGGWLTSITVTNLEGHSTSFDVLFFQDDGSDFNVPLVGLSGLSPGVTVTLAPMGTLTSKPRVSLPPCMPVGRYYPKPTAIRSEFQPSCAKVFRDCRLKKQWSRQ
jgi:hypothetical protein